MDNALANPTFVPYAITTVILTANMLGLWMYTGVARAGTKTTENAEDSAAFGTALTDEEPPEVARVMRAFKNAQANVVPFLFLGLVYVLAGGTPTAGKVIFGIFTLARLVHSVAYLSGKQPYRTLSFFAGLITSVVLMVFIVLALAR